MSRKDAGWWSKRFNSGSGLGVINCNPNGWSHDRRMAKIREEVGSGRTLLDLGCGTGLYGLMHPDSARYVGVDFCQEYIELAKRTVHGEFHCMSIKDFAKSNVDRFDASILCGMLSIEPAFDNEEAVFDFVQSLLSFSDKVVATMPWSGFAFEETEHTTAIGLRKFSADSVVTHCHDRGMSVRLISGHMPHEILGVFTNGSWDQMKIDNSTREAIERQLQAVGRI